MLGPVTREQYVSVPVSGVASVTRRHLPWYWHSTLWSHSRGLLTGLNGLSIESVIWGFSCLINRIMHRESKYCDSQSDLNSPPIVRHPVECLSRNIHHDNLSRPSDTVHGGDHRTVSEPVHHHPARELLVIAGLKIARYYRGGTNCQALKHQPLIKRKVKTRLNLVQITTVKIAGA